MVFILFNYRLNSRLIESFVVWISFYLRGFTWCCFCNIYIENWMNVLLSSYLSLFHFLESTRYYQKLKIFCWLKIVWLHTRMPISKAILYNFLEISLMCIFLEIRFFDDFNEIVTVTFCSLINQEVFSWWPLKIFISCFWYIYCCFAF